MPNPAKAAVRRPKHPTKSRPLSRGRRETFRLDRSTLNPVTARVVAVIDAAANPGDTTSDTELLRTGVQAACRSRKSGLLDSWAVAAALLERDVALGVVPDLKQTFDYTQYMLRSEVPGVVGASSRGIYRIDRAALGTKKGRRSTATPAAAPASSAAGTSAKPARRRARVKQLVNADAASVIETARFVERNRKDTAALRRSLGSMHKYKASAPAADLTPADLVAQKQKMASATIRHELIRAVFYAGTVATGKPGLANVRLDGCVVVEGPDASDRWLILEAKSITRENFIAQVGAGVGQLRRCVYDYQFDEEAVKNGVHMLYLAVDNLRQVAPDDLAFAVRFAEQHDVQLVHLVSHAADTYSFEPVKL